MPAEDLFLDRGYDPVICVLFRIEAARERISDAMAVRFDDIVGYQATGS